MKPIIRRASRQLYKRAVKPALFTMTPDAVHHQLVRFGSGMGKVPLLKSLPRMWRYSHPAMLSQTYHGVSFENPVGLSAGFDKNIQLPTLLHAVGFGFMTGGSVTHLPCDGNARPWFHRLPNTQSLLVHAGLPNEGVDRVAARIDAYDERIFAHMPLVVSVAKTNVCEVVDDARAIDDYIASLAELELHQHIAAYELNISCPNTFGGEPFTTHERLEQLLYAVDSLKLQRPLYVKMPIDLEWRAFSQLLAVIARHNVQAVTIGNLAKDRTKVDFKDDITDDMKGNMSGAPTRELSTELIRKTYEEYGDRLMIIGVGGIFSAEHAYEKIRAGASLLGLITGMIFEGPQVVGQINQDLVRLLKRDGYTHISEAIGVDVNKKTKTAV